MTRHQPAAMLAILAGMAAGCSTSKPPLEDFTAEQVGIVDTYVRSSVPDARWAEEPGLIVGGWGDSYHALIRMDLSAAPELATGERALLMLYNTSTNPEQQPTDVNVSVLTNPFAEDINWNGASLLTDQPTGTVHVGSFDSWTEIDISDAYRAWQGGGPNNGLRLVALRTDNFFDVFVSSESPDIEHRPRLRIVRPPQ